jgi:hypothetical protein
MNFLWILKTAINVLLKFDIKGLSITFSAILIFSYVDRIQSLTLQKAINGLSKISHKRATDFTAFETVHYSAT